MTKSKNEILVTAEEYQRSGERYYGLAADMEDRNEPQKKIDANWKSASMDFWCALTLGSTKAPFSLFKCFGQGLGVKEDNDIAALMYGTALKFTPEDCAKIPASSKSAIAKSMQPRIDKLVELVKQTNKEIPAEGTTIEKFLDQMDKFNDAIKLPSGKSIESCFTEKITEDKHKEKELKSKALELTKNLSNKSKTTMATKNHNSRKTNNVTSRNGFSIL